jgi:hypothetical protein
MSHIATRTPAADRRRAARTVLFTIMAAGLLAIFLAPTTGTQARWHAEAVVQTPAVALDRMALSVPASPAGLATTVTNTARATTAMWRPATLTVTIGGKPVPATALGGTAISYATGTAGTCAAAPPRWTVTPALAIGPAAGASPRETLVPGGSAGLCVTIRPSADLLAQYPGQTLALTTTIDAQASAPATWTAPPVTWTSTYQVPAHTLASCRIVSSNDKNVEVAWSWPDG